MNDKDRKEIAAMFNAKNMRRKRGRSNGSRRQQEHALVLRRLTGGKFGNMSSDEWNLRVAGTTGGLRSGGGGTE